MNLPFRTLLVEDEPVALRSLRRLAEESESLEVVGEAKDGPRALELLDSLKPDLVLLDVELPGLTGLDVLKRSRSTPYVIFTTAYDLHAATAFELGAVDYLVKPFGQKRFDQAIDRMVARGRPSGRVDERPVELPEESSDLRWIFARQGERVVPIPTDRVSRFEAQGEYVRVHVDGRAFLVQISLAELEQRLPESFLRIHRSHLVQLEHVVQLVRHDDRRFEVQMNDGATVIASRAGSKRLRVFIR